MNKRLLLLLLLFFAFNVTALHGQALNKDGSIVTGVLTASFNPRPLPGVELKLPFPTTLLYADSTDLTINIPGTDPSNFSDPRVALNALDGFSTIEKWTTEFANNDDGDYDNSVPGEIDPSSVVPGQSVRVFQVTTQALVAVTGIIRELTPEVDYVAVAATSSVLAIIPTQPLPEYSSFMAVLTNDIKDIDGNDATPDRFYNFAKQQTPWVDENGISTSPLFDNETAAGLEGFRQIVQSMELNAASVGINPADIILSWTVQTQSITPTLKFLRSIAQPAPTQIVPTPAKTPFGLADIHIGIITLPYYLGIPSEQNPVKMLTDFWVAAPGAYIPPFDQIGLDPTSTNLTFANPIPVLTGMQTVPLIMTVPNANSGFSKPAEGWPVVIYQHGVTRNRTDVLAIADTIAQTGHVVISMDQPLHGVVPDVDPRLAPFYIENTPFADFANERTFDCDLINNETGERVPDGLMDPSGTHSFNLENLRALRDNNRQATADLSILALSLQHMSIDGDATPDLNAFNVTAVTQSLGGIVSVPFAAIEPILSRLYINATGGGLVRLTNGGHFGPDAIQPALAAVGIDVGTPEFEAFLTIAQTVVDSGDAINWAVEAAMKMPIIHNQVQEDETVPNVVPGAPLSGSEGLNRVMGLTSYSTTQADPEGLSGVARFLQPADHESLFVPLFPEVTAEMQGQMASFIVSGGTFVNVGNPDLLVPIPAQPAQSDKASTAKSEGKPARDKNRAKSLKRDKVMRGHEDE